MSIVIKIETGYVGATHEIDTGMEREEWDELPDKEKHDWITDEVWNHIDAYAIDEDTDEAVG